MDRKECWHGTAAPDLTAMEELAQRALESLPSAFSEAAKALAIRVVDFADAAVLRDIGISDPFDLTGLYDGIPMTEKSVMDQPDRPDVIWLFRRPILEEWIARGDVALDRLVAHVLIHELAHHFGWSDADIAKIDRWWE